MRPDMYMKNTIKQVTPEFKILFVPDAAMPDADFMRVLSSTIGDFILVLRVSSKDVIMSTGMIAIPSAIVTASDVGRVLEVATSLSCKDDVVMHVSPTYSFLLFF